MLALQQSSGTLSAQVAQAAAARSGEQQRVGDSLVELAARVGQLADSLVRTEPIKPQPDEADRHGEALKMALDGSLSADALLKSLSEKLQSTKEAAMLARR